MKVKMLMNTNFQGFRKIGDIVEVDGTTMERWVQRGIAETAAVIVEAEAKEEVAIENMSAKKLYKLCVEKDLDVVAKESKEYYIQKLNENVENVENVEGKDIEE